MAAYYMTHENNNNTNINEHHANNLHTLILMNNPNNNNNNNNLQSSQFDEQHHLLNSPPPPYPNNFVHPDRPNNVTLYGYPQEEAREVTRARQGLSLSLSSQNPGAVVGPGGQVSIFGSKYLKVAQELLEEIVNVNHTLISNTNTNTNNIDDHSPKKGKRVGDTLPEESEKEGVVQLSTSEKHEIQMKKAKLVSMLDEAEQRYRHYNNQMQMVIESFERAAGIGSAKTYTALALKTISKQFRCLKDAIQGQIQAANKSLGEDDGGSGSSAGKIQGSRLKFIDHQIRQQRALQQLGMIQNHNAWRPQRGLPERSVSVLRAWLFEHFLHPYPKDSDKILLAKQTGLTRSQVSNWFINARVRLWKPMIEDMYNEELKEHEQNGSENKSNSNEDVDGASNSVMEQDQKINNIVETQIKPVKLNQQHTNNVANNSSSSSSFMSIPQHGFTLNGSLEMGAIAQGSPKRQRSNEMLNNGEILIEFGNEKQERNNGYPIISGGMNFLGGELGSYPNMGDLGRFETEEFSTQRFLQGNNNGGISLSLGLPPSCENHHHQQFNDLSATNHTFMSPNQNIQFRRGNDFGYVQ